MARKILNDRADFEIGSDNVYADLGFADSSAMLVKAQLTSKIGKGLEARALTPVTAAELRMKAPPSSAFRRTGTWSRLSCGYSER